MSQVPSEQQIRGSKKKIALICPDSFSLMHFWGSLIEELILCGHTVITITGDNDSYSKKLVRLGAKHHCVTLARFISPVKDLWLIWDCFRIFKREKPEIVHNFSIKPNIYGTIAARLAGIPWVVCTVVGLGFTFSQKDQTLSTRIRAYIVRCLMKCSMKRAQRVCFVNSEDLRVLANLHTVHPDSIRLIESAIGVDIDYFSQDRISKDTLQKIREDATPGESKKIVCMVVARLVWSKGIKEFIEAAQILQRSTPCRFMLVGPLDPTSPDAVPEEYLKNKIVPTVHWIPFTESIREYIGASDCFVLPTYYGEGLPQVILEAMALSIPVVATNNVGCREVIEDGSNGILVEPKDTHALVEGLLKVLNDASAAQKFAQNGRITVESRFSKRIINSRIQSELYE